MEHVKNIYLGTAKCIFLYLFEKKGVL